MYVMYRTCTMYHIYVLLLLECFRVLRLKCMCTTYIHTYARIHEASHVVHVYYTHMTYNIRVPGTTYVPHMCTYQVHMCIMNVCMMYVVCSMQWSHIFLSGHESPPFFFFDLLSHDNVLATSSLFSTPSFFLRDSTSIVVHLRCNATNKFNCFFLIVLIIITVH